MAGDSLKRKLAAIFCADVEGYSRLMGDDEVSTVRTITEYRQVMAGLIHDHDGRVVDSPGDNLLAEFASAVDATRCAWEIQAELAGRNAALPENRRMLFRIGINLGDVIDQEGQLFGGGVNVAARLEGLAESGGISISGTVYDQVKDRLPYRFEYLGERQVKNITEPIRLYRVVMNPRTGAIRPRKKGKGALKIATLILVAAILSAMVFGVSSRIDLRIGTPAHPPASDGGVRQNPRSASIAVLPFKNLSGEPEQEYFSDGITNDIITDLSRFRDLLVVASSSVFQYKDVPVDIQAVGRDLSVRYVLEGSVQKDGNMVRINAQLIDAAEGTHIWAERYEREYEDIFTLQGEIVQAIVVTLAINITRTEQVRALRKKPQDLQAYDYLLRGWAYYYRRTQEANILAGEMFDKAAELDPHFSAAFVGLGWVEYAKAGNGWTEYPQQALDNAFSLGRKALEEDRSNASAHTLLSNVYTFLNKYELAIREAEQALDLNPNDVSAFGQLGWALLWAGRLDEAAAALEMSLQMDNTSVGNAWLHLGTAYYLKGQYLLALEILEKGVVKQPEYVGYYIVLAATYAKLGRAEEAVSAAQTILRLDPFFKAEAFGTAFREPAHRAAIAEGLREAGLD